MQSHCLSRLPLRSVVQQGRRLTVSWSTQQSQLVPDSLSTEDGSGKLLASDKLIENGHLSLSNMKEFVKNHNLNVDLEKALEQYNNLRQCTKTPYLNHLVVTYAEPPTHSFNKSNSVSALKSMDGRSLDKIFGIETGTDKVNYQPKNQCTKEDKKSGGCDKVHFQPTKDLTDLFLLTAQEFRSVALMSPNSQPSKQRQLLSHPVELEGIIMCSPLEKSEGSDGGSKNSDPQSSSKPNLDQLNNMQDYLTEVLPKIVNHKHDYSIYTQDVIFENNFNPSKPKTTVGISPYAAEVAKMRFYMHLRYTRLRSSVERGWVDEKRGTVRLHWKVECMSQWRTFMFWKITPFKMAENVAKESKVIEGISTFYLNKEGLITKHVVDRMMPDDEPLKSKKNVLEKLVRKAVPTPT